MLILKWLSLNENIKYILSDDIKIHKHKNFYFTKEGDSFELDNLKIITFGGKISNNSEIKESIKNEMLGKLKENFDFIEDKNINTLEAFKN